MVGMKQAIHTASEVSNEPGKTSSQTLQRERERESLKSKLPKKFSFSFSSEWGDGELFPFSSITYPLHPQSVSHLIKLLFLSDSHLSISLFLQLRLFALSSPQQDPSPQSHLGSWSIPQTTIMVTITSLWLRKTRKLERFPLKLTFFVLGSLKFQPFP